MSAAERLQLHLDAFSQSSSPRLKVSQTVTPSSSSALLLVLWPPGNLAADENVSVQWHLRPIPAPAQRTLLHLGQRSACARAHSGAALQRRGGVGGQCMLGEDTCAHTNTHRTTQ